MPLNSKSVQLYNNVLVYHSVCQSSVQLTGEYLMYWFGGYLSSKRERKKPGKVIGRVMGIESCVNIWTSMLEYQ